MTRPLAWLLPLALASGSLAQGWVSAPPPPVAPSGTVVAVELKPDPPLPAGQYVDPPPYCVLLRAGHPGKTAGSWDWGYGTAVIVASNREHSLVVTCRHVIEGDTKFECVLPGRKDPVPATMLSLATFADCALLTIPIGSLPSVPAAPFDAQVGDELTAMGYGPDKKFRQVTSTVTGWALTKANPSVSLMLRAEIRKGDSGGPVLNAQGEFVGIGWGTARGSSYVTPLFSIQRLAKSATNARLGEADAVYMSCDSACGGSCDPSGGAMSGCDAACGGSCDPSGGTTPLAAQLQPVATNYNLPPSRGPFRRDPRFPLLGGPDNRQAAQPVGAPTLQPVCPPPTTPPTVPPPTPPPASPDSCCDELLAKLAQLEAQIKAGALDRTKLVDELSQAIGDRLAELLATDGEITDKELQILLQRNTQAIESLGKQVATLDKNQDAAQQKLTELQVLLQRQTASSEALTKLVSGLDDRADALDAKVDELALVMQRSSQESYQRLVSALNGSAKVKFRFNPSTGEILPAPTP